MITALIIRLIQQKYIVYATINLLIASDPIRNEQGQIIDCKISNYIITPFIKGNKRRLLREIRF